MVGFSDQNKLVSAAKSNNQYLDPLFYKYSFKTDHSLSTKICKTVIDCAKRNSKTFKTILECQQSQQEPYNVKIMF